ncbi:MAG: xanthine dehydrogenase family protein subunit M [Acetobacteraceae bacterium]|nr:xanthine dehydrogenase family protein subunit M [Acetobacteraceae bacterium]
MKPAAFDYARPASVAAALQALADRAREAKVLAGGQSLVPMMNFRMARPAVLVDINRLAELDYHRVEGDTLAIGALARHAALRASPVVRASCPLMAETYHHVANGPVRNQGTLCGNLCHADPASEMPAVALVTDAAMVLRSARGERRLDAAAFFRGVYETAARPDELLVEVRIPAAPANQGWSFQEVSVRKGDFAIVGVAATLAVAKGSVAEARIAVCGVGPRAARLRDVERSLTGRPAAEASFGAAADAAAASVNPQEDVNASAAYRRDLVRALVRRALAEAGGRAG